LANTGIHRFSLIVYIDLSLTNIPYQWVNFL